MSGLHLRWIICTLCLRLGLLIGDMTSVLCLPKSYYDHFGPLALCPVIKADFLLHIKTNSERFLKSTWLKRGGGVAGWRHGCWLYNKKKCRSRKIFPAVFGAAQSIDPSGATLSLSNPGKKTAFRQREPLIYEGWIRWLARKTTAFCFTPGPFRGMDGQVKSRRHCLASLSAHLAT